MLHVAQREDLRLARDAHVVTDAPQDLAHEVDDVLVLGAVLLVRHKLACQLASAIRVLGSGARPRQAHALKLLAALANEQLGRAAAEEHVGVAVEHHRAARIAIYQVDQQVLRGERMLGAKPLPAREHHLANAPRANGRKRVVHFRPPLLARVALQRERHYHALATRGGRRLARETRDAARIHRGEAVHLQHAPAFVFHEHHLGQHEPKAREGLEELVGGLGILRVEAVEREEHRRLVDRSLNFVFHAFHLRQRNATPQAHVAVRALLVVVDELVGEALLQKAEPVDDVGIDGLGIRVDAGHGQSFRETCCRQLYRYHAPAPQHERSENAEASRPSRTARPPAPPPSRSPSRAPRGAFPLRALPTPPSRQRSRALHAAVAHPSRRLPPPPRFLDANPLIE